MEQKGAIEPAGQSPPPAGNVYLGFFAGASGFGAAVTAGEFLDPTGGIDELLFASEKRMAGGANADLDIPTS
jgi:hypothetical protein